jgi:hypothetical protein
MRRKSATKEIIIESCRECPHHGYTESSWYCKKMRLSRYTWKEIVDIDMIHDLCPLDDSAE